MKKEEFGLAAYREKFFQNSPIGGGLVLMAHDNVVRICFTSACYSGQNERPFSDYTNIIQFQPKIVFRNLHQWTGFYVITVSVMNERVNHRVTGIYQNLLKA